MERCARKPAYLPLQIGEDSVSTFLTQFIESLAEIREFMVHLELESMQVQPR
jgi:hypothetical protein